MSTAVVVYPAIVSVFMLIQVVAFVWAHVDYREDVENPKYQIFKSEKEIV